jgi:hypothetical protein
MSEAILKVVSVSDGQLAEKSHKRLTRQKRALQLVLQLDQHEQAINAIQDDVVDEFDSAVEALRYAMGTAVERQHLLFIEYVLERENGNISRLIKQIDLCRLHRTRDDTDRYGVLTFVGHGSRDCAFSAAARTMQQRLKAVEGDSNERDVWRQGVDGLFDPWGPHEKYLWAVEPFLTSLCPPIKHTLTHLPEDGDTDGQTNTDGDFGSTQVHDLFFWAVNVGPCACCV